jgi:hypothetical protein
MTRWRLAQLPGLNPATTRHDGSPQLRTGERGLRLAQERGSGECLDAAHCIDACIDSDRTLIASSSLGHVLYLLIVVPTLRTSVGLFHKLSKFEMWRLMFAKNTTTRLRDRMVQKLL